MAIAVTCGCGKKLRVNDELAGKRARCPDCRSAVDIPLASRPMHREQARDQAGVDEGTRRPAPAVEPASRPSSRRSPWLWVAIAAPVAALVVCGGVGAWIAASRFASSENRHDGPPDSGNAGLPGAEKQAISDDIFASIATAMKEDRVQVDEKGFVLGSPQYWDIPLEGGILIGLQAGVSPFGARNRVESLRPIYLTKNGETLGHWYGPAFTAPTIVKAKPGYAVGGADIRVSVFLDSFQLKFMKLHKDRLQAEDAYVSEWIGEGVGQVQTVGGNGALVVGMCCHIGVGKDVCSLGTITMPKKR
jgi:hypothetical protein